jgi:hypothetical protein
LGLSKAIIQALVDNFVARTTDLYTLVPKQAQKQTDHEREIRAALKRLREYYDPHEKKNEVDRRWGYIRSVSWSDPTIDNQIEYTCLVHGLTDRGLRLARDRGLDPDRHGKSFQEFSADHVDHELRINDLIAALRAELHAQGLELIIERTHIKGATVAPDLLFHIYDPTTDMRSAPFFLEYERQKRGRHDDGGRPQIIRKLESFANYYNSDLCQNEFCFRKFYVIVILRTERKANFLLQDLAERKLTIKTFLIASEPALTPAILQTKFRTPNDFASFSYSLLDI